MQTLELESNKILVIIKLNMKTKLSKLSFCFSLLLLITACDEDLKIFDPNNGQTLVAFSARSVNFPVVIDMQEELAVTVNVTTVSDVDRVFNFSVVQEDTTIDSGNFALASNSVTIPAGEFTGTFNITGIDDENLDTDSKKLVLELTEGSDFVTGPKVDVNIFQVCPVPSDFFTGTYAIQQLSGSGPFGIGAGFNNQTVEITALGLFRNFTFIYGVGSFDSDYTMQLEMVCNTIRVNGFKTPNTGTLGCGTGSIGQSTATTPGTYDVFEGDDQILVRLRDFDPDSGCGAAAQYTAELLFVKQ